MAQILESLICCGDEQKYIAGNGILGKAYRGWGLRHIVYVMKYC